VLGTPGSFPQIAVPPHPSRRAGISCLSPPRTQEPLPPCSPPRRLLYVGDFPLAIFSAITVVHVFPRPRFLFSRQRLFWVSWLQPYPGTGFSSFALLPAQYNPFPSERGSFIRVEATFFLISSPMDNLPPKVPEPLSTADVRFFVRFFRDKNVRCPRELFFRCELDSMCFLFTLFSESLRSSLTTSVPL